MERALKYLMPVLAVVFIIAGCKQSLVISEVDYSQPIETVLTPDDEGIVSDVQHGISFNILPLQYAETQDTSEVRTREVRFIRGTEGYYYITAPNFKHVYVMVPEKGKLKVDRKIMISENGVEDPAFNQRAPYIQLLNRKSGETYTLNFKGIQNSSTEKEQQGG